MCSANINLRTQEEIKYCISGRRFRENEKRMKAFIEVVNNTSDQDRVIVNTIIGGFGSIKSRKESKTM